MKITIEPTDQIVVVEGIPVRVWSGVTDRGTKCAVFVALIGVDDAAAPEFETLVDMTERVAPPAAPPTGSVH